MTHLIVFDHNFYHVFRNTEVQRQITFPLSSSKELKKSDFNPHLFDFKSHSFAAMSFLLKKTVIFTISKNMDSYFT